MAIFLHNLNYRSLCFGNIYRDRPHYRSSHNQNTQNIVVRVSSETIPNEGSRKFQETTKITRSSTDVMRCQTGALYSQDYAVGIIGGFSAFSTLMFLEKLVWWSSKNGGECVPFIVCSDPAIKEGFSHHETLVDVQNSQAGVCNNAAIVENLKEKRVFLEKSGVKCIVMPCHLSHILQAEVSEGCQVVFLSVSDCVANELKQEKLKPLEAGSNVRIGILAADPKLMDDFYREKLQNQGYEVVLPDKAMMEHMVVPAVDALKKKDSEGAINLIRIAIQSLLVRAVNKIILASDEFQGILPCNDPLLKNCIDPMDALARSTIQSAKSFGKLHNLNGT